MSFNTEQPKVKTRLPFKKLILQLVIRIFKKFAPPGLEKV